MATDFTNWMNAAEFATWLKETKSREGAILVPADQVDIIRDACDKFGWMVMSVLETRGLMGAKLAQVTFVKRTPVKLPAPPTQADLLQRQIEDTRELLRKAFPTVPWTDAPRSNPHKNDPLARKPTNPLPPRTTPRPGVGSSRPVQTVKAVATVKEPTYFELRREFIEKGGIERKERMVDKVTGEFDEDGFIVKWNPDPATKLWVPSGRHISGLKLSKEEYLRREGLLPRTQTPTAMQVFTLVYGLGVVLFFILAITGVI